MGHRAKSPVNLKVLAVLFTALFLLFLWREWNHSLIMHETDRINIGVYGPQPFVYSYNPHERLAFVVYFNPDYQIDLPGGYGWYKLGSVGYLGRIEKKKATLLRAAFSELIGAPVDLVFYPRETAVYNRENASFREYYQKQIRQELFSKAYTHSLTNLFDQLLIRSLFQVRFDRTVLIGTNDLVFTERGKNYYDPEVLDTRLKGLFYHQSIISIAQKGILVVSEEDYPAAKKILRQLEGIGLKVMEIRVEPVKGKECVVSVNRGDIIENKIKRMYGCRVDTNSRNSSLIKLVISHSLAEKYK